MQVVSLATIDLLLEVKTKTLRDTITNQGFLNGLAQLDGDLENLGEQSQSRYRLAEDTLLGISFSATVGALAWILRGGAIFTGLMAATPIWASIDATRIVSSSRMAHDSSKSTDDEGEVEQIFDK